MSTYHYKNFILFSILLGLSQVSWAACDQTLSTGANLASAISGAAAGTTICLNNGNYGNVTLSGINKSSPVTIQSTNGTGATMNVTSLASSNGITFKNLTISGLMWSGNANTNIKVLNNTFTGQMYIYGNDNGSPQKNIIDGNTFDGITVCANCREGRLSIYGGNDLVVSNNHFGGAGESDGIQWGGYGGTVGPGNVFEGLIQGSYSRHIDSIQMYGEVDHQTVTGNYFTNDTVYIGAYDRGTNITITNNVFGVGNGQIQLLGIVGGTFAHNTIKSSFGVWQGAKNGDPTTKNITYNNNLLIGVSISDGGGDQHGCASGCTYDHNLFSSSGNARGTNNIIGSPAFVGGSNPTTWSGYSLTSSSIGYKAATDGNDIGGNYFGAGTVPPPLPVILPLAAPSNLRTF
jgi:hypothetical protein